MWFLVIIYYAMEKETEIRTGSPCLISPTWRTGFYGTSDNSNSSAIHLCFDLELYRIFLFFSKYCFIFRKQFSTMSCMLYASNSQDGFFSTIQSNISWYTCTHSCTSREIYSGESLGLYASIIQNTWLSLYNVCVHASPTDGRSWSFEILIFFNNLRFCFLVKTMS